MLSGLMDRLFKDKPGNDAFAERFIAAAHRHGMTAPMTYEADLFRIRVGDGSYFHLFNAHRAYLDAERGKQQEALDMFVRSLRPGDDGDAGWNALRPLLRPILRSISQLEQVLDTPLELGELPELARAWERGVDELAAEDSEVAEYVTSLEQQQDATDLPEASGEVIAAEFERYLRRRQGH